MERTEQITKLIKRTNENDVGLLEQLLEDAESAVKDYCNRDTVPDRAAGLCRDLAIVYYCRLGHEGELSRSEGAISVSYDTTIPETIKARLNAYRLLKAVGMANENMES